jgi:MFS superfamily sulfate permease-like transporter
MTKPSFAASLKSDFPASIVVFLVALPLCLGIALASGAPLFSGIIAGIVGGIVVGSISGSSLGVSGPAAGLAVLVAEAIRELGTNAEGVFDLNLGFQYFLVAGVIAGIIQVILGLAKAGIIGYFFPTSVIKGMLAGIGITLILKQIPHALGYDKNPEGAWDFYQIDGRNTFSEILYSFQNFSEGAVIITLVSIAILLLWQKKAIQSNKILKLIPGPLLAVASGIAINYFFGVSVMDWFLDNEKSVSTDGQVLFNNHRVFIEGPDSSKPYFGLLTFPDFSILSNPRIYIIGITMAIVASLETLLSVEATDKLDPYKRTTPTNRELLAQGAGNIVSALIGGLPVTQVIVRSSANVNAGGKTKNSAILHSLILMVFVLALPQLLNLIPLACLAAVLLLVGYKLSSIQLFKKMYKDGWNQFVPFVVTILMIVFTNLLYGIIAGLVVAIFYILRNNFRNAFYAHYKETKEDASHPHTQTIEFGEVVSFFNKANLQDKLCHIPENSEVIIDGSKSTMIDYDILDLLNDFEISAQTKGIKVKFVNIKFDQVE